MLKQLVKKSIAALGYELVPAETLQPIWNLARFFQLLNSFGFSPRHIWDVGANRGAWTRAAIRYFPDSEFTLLEPQDQLKENIEDLIRLGHKIRWINAGAGAHSGRFPFYVDRRDPGSSFLDLPRITQEAVQCIEVPMFSLNEVLASLSLPVPEMLKIDAEGLDLKVLEGATHLLGKTEIILAEASINQLDFENTPRALIDAMEGYGYRLIDITDLNRSPAHGVLWLCEFAFLQKSSLLLDRASRY